MKTTLGTRVGAGLLVLLGAVAPAQIQEVQETRARFDTARLEQMVAPIALYPDSLLTHVLMAATYPIEVVEADRYVRANPGQSAEVLQNAIAGTGWDPSVKALAGLPDVLKMMSENLDWTRDLGDAFLSQRTELLDAVQRMRVRARDAGTLQTTPEQTVTVQEPGTIVVESASPDVIYVPTYSPLSVYGSWGYPSWYYPGFYNYRYPFAFSLGFTWGNWLWARPYWGWGSGDVFVDSGRYNRFNQYWNRDWSSTAAVQGDRFRWAHDPNHRLGARYRDAVTARQYGGDSSQFVPRDRTRRFDSTTPRTQIPNTSTPERVLPPARAPERVAPIAPNGVGKTRAPEFQRRVERAPSNAPSNVERREIAPAPRAQPQMRGPVQRQVPRSSTTWTGSRNPSFDRKAMDRGTRSRGNSRGGNSEGGNSGGGREARPRGGRDKE